MRDKLKDMKDKLTIISDDLNYDIIDEKEARTLLLDLLGVSKRFSEMEEAGKEATLLIAQLKDQYGFNEVEEEVQDKIMKVFKYKGRW